MFEFERVTTKFLHVGDLIVVDGPRGSDPTNRKYDGCAVGAITSITGSGWKHIDTTTRNVQCGAASKNVRIINIGRGNLAANGDLLDDVKLANGFVVGGRA